LTQWRGLPAGVSEVRLPSEAEWEYACRAGSETDFYNGDGEAALAEVGWFKGNSYGETHPVDERPELHPLGLYGLHGNVWEWCQDVYDVKAYRKRAHGWLARAWNLADAGYDAFYWSAEDRLKQSAARVFRGGCSISSARLSRSAFRSGTGWVSGTGICGFRVCLVRGPAASKGGAPAGGPDLARITFPAQRGRKR
jgi:formylglycine-generating enzyme required for sulfatase activity